MKNIVRRSFNRLLHALARSSPGALTVRPLLHRMRGVKIGRNVWIGDDVYLENEYPENVELQEGVVLSIRSVIIAHTRGSGNIVIERFAFIGPTVVVICESGRTLRIGEGAAICAGAVVTTSVAPRMLVAPPASKPMARITIPFRLAESVNQFVAGLQPLKRGPSNGPKDCAASHERQPLD
jgi:acetyltransferase-like isoleucine patch superfamily enzyme